MRYILEYNNFEVDYIKITEDEYQKMIKGDDYGSIGVDDRYFDEKYMYRLNHLEKKFVDMSDSEVDKIKNVFPESFFVGKSDIIQNLIPIKWRNKKNLPSGINDYISRDYKLYSCVINNMINMPSNKLFVTIIKNNDDWYLVEESFYDTDIDKMVYSYYKCDQFEGLMQYLLSLKNKNIF